MSSVNGGSLVFFGLESVFSSVTLSLLSAGGFLPRLVVLGDPSRIPNVRRLRARPGLLGRVFRPANPGTGLARRASELGVDVIEATHPGDPRVLRAVAGVRPEAFVVAGFHRLLPAELLALPSRGGLNLHPGRLPQERGPAPLFWALKRGHRELGFAVHILDKGEDSGDVVAAGTYATPIGWDGQDILERCAVTAAPFLIRALRDLLEGEIVRIKQDESRASRCPRPNLEDGKIDVTLSAEQVFNFVAGCARHYVVFARCAGDTFFVSEATSYDLEAKLSYDFVLSGDRLILRTNPGVVELILKPDGAHFTSEYDE
ncbi:MAG: hypothetical protein HY791_08510 [Deltaproteobacteria bacterium]|nr:hypothetical protein [Deltaproteobacteria bacterium]